MTYRNFNAAIKVNAHEGRYPDGGLVEGVLITNDTPRQTSNPVAMFDLVAASDWTVRRTIFADPAKQGGDGVSYAGFFKGGGRRGVFEQNLVLCRWRHRGGARIGLSLGGGGTGASYCRNGRCDNEHEGGTIRNNIIAGCSDVGIYLNKATNARVHNNLIYRTRGVDGRFPETSAALKNNIIDGRVLARDGAKILEKSNLRGRLKAVTLSSTAESVLADPGAGAFGFSTPSNAAAQGSPVTPAGEDLCGRVRDQSAPGIGPFIGGKADCVEGLSTF
jgi:parallel beta-helix repeat protein